MGVDTLRGIAYSLYRFLYHSLANRPSIGIVLQLPTVRPSNAFGNYGNAQFPEHGLCHLYVAGAYVEVGLGFNYLAPAEDFSHQVLLLAAKLQHFFYEFFNGNIAEFWASQPVTIPEREHVVIDAPYA